jgi:hypothetical protein
VQTGLARVSLLEAGLETSLRHAPANLTPSSYSSASQPASQPATPPLLSCNIVCVGVGCLHGRNLRATRCAVCLCRVYHLSCRPRLAGCGEAPVFASLPLHAAPYCFRPIGGWCALRQAPTPSHFDRRGIYTPQPPLDPSLQSAIATALSSPPCSSSSSNSVCGCLVVCTVAIQMGHTVRCVPATRVSPVLPAFLWQDLLALGRWQFLPARLCLSTLLRLSQ